MGPPAPPNPDLPPAPPRRPACEAARAAHQTLLDGESADRAALEEHLAGCPSCRAWSAAADRVARALRRSPPPPVPAGLRERLVRAVIADRRRRRSRILRLRLAAGALAAAASVLIGLWAAGAFRPSGPENHLTGNTPHALERPRAPEPAPAEWASLEDGLAEVTGAVIELTRRTADETVQQTRLFLPMPGEVPPALEFPDPGGALGPAARSLGEIQQGAVVALSPVGDSAVRAVRLFLGNPSGPSDPGS